MATKKQKRAAALAKREAFMAEERERGLQAQQAGREEEKRKDDEARKRIASIDDSMPRSLLMLARLLENTNR
jgi:hypothetical protein